VVNVVRVENERKWELRVEMIPHMRDEKIHALA